MKTLKAWGGDPWGCMQNPIHRKRVRHSYFESDTKIFQICSAVFSKKCQLSILGTNKYSIIDENFIGLGRRPLGLYAKSNP